MQYPQTKNLLEDFSIYCMITIILINTVKSVCLLIKNIDLFLNTISPLTPIIPKYIQTLKRAIKIWNKWTPSYPLGSQGMWRKMGLEKNFRMRSLMVCDVSVTITYWFQLRRLTIAFTKKIKKNDKSFIWGTKAASEKSIVILIHEHKII